jgi:hypothetical protein
MTRFILIVGIVVALGASARNGRADEPKPEQIIEKAIRGHGGEERLNGLTGFSLKDRVVYEKGPTWNYEVDAAPPTRYRSEIKSGPQDKNTTLVVIDGDHGRMKRGDDVETYPPTFLDSMRKNTIPSLRPRSILVLVTTYEDYQNFDGFPIARKEITQRDGKPASTRELIEFKVAMPSEGAFAKP